MLTLWLNKLLAISGKFLCLVCYLRVTEWSPLWSRTLGISDKSYFLILRMAETKNARNNLNTLRCEWASDKEKKYNSDT